MKQKIEVQGVSRPARIGEIATVYCAPEDEGFFGALLARAVSNHEHGIPGRAC
jgi:hypothetical protein